MSHSNSSPEPSRSEDDEWLRRVYDELRKLAATKLSNELPGQSLQPTALVHEAYLRLISRDGGAVAWDSTGHYFAAAAEAMRRILIERARLRGRQKRGGDRQRQPLLPDSAVADEENEDILAVDEALQKFAVTYPVQAQLVRLRYFAGLSIDQAADAMKLSRTTAKRYWSFARAWLVNELS